MILTALAILAAICGVLWIADVHRRARQKRRCEQDAAMLPMVRDAVAAYLGGKHDLSQLRHFAASFATAVQETIFDFQARLGGGDRERLGVLAIDLGFIQAWCQDAQSRDTAVRRSAFSRLAALSSCESVRRLSDDLPERGLKDSDPKVRPEATRALFESDERRHVEIAFEAALSLSPSERLQLSPAIRRHAMQLCEEAIPKALAKSSEGDLLVLLRILNSWECVLMLADLGDLADHPSAAVRAETMRLLAMAPPTPQNRRALMTGLASMNVEVSLAAVYALGRLRLHTAIPNLTACLRRGSESLAKAAAAVLAGLGPDARCALEDQLPNPDPIASGAAREALQEAV
jgi:hypothetical protein